MTSGINLRSGRISPSETKIEPDRRLRLVRTSQQNEIRQQEVPAGFYFVLRCVVPCIQSFYISIMDLLHIIILFYFHEV